MSTISKDPKQDSVRKNSSNDKENNLTPQYSQNSKSVTRSNFTKSKEDDKLNSENSFAYYGKKKEKQVKNKNPFEFNYTFEELFNTQNLKEIFENEEPKHAMFKFLFIKSSKKKGEEIQSNIIKALSEFHIQNYNFLKENFPDFPIEVICKIMNIFANLLVLNEEEYNINFTESETSRIVTNLKKKSTTDSEDTSDIKKNIQIPEPDVSYLANRKLMEMKLTLVKLGLFPSKKNLTENTDDNNFYLNTNELQIIMDYLNMFFFPNIRLYYHFINIKRINETKKIVILVNRPAPIPPLSESVQVIERKDYEDIDDEDLNEEKKGSKDGDLDEKQSSDVTYEVLKKINYNNEVLKILTEKCEEIKKDVDARIEENTKEVTKVLEQAKEQAAPGKKK